DTCDVHSDDPADANCLAILTLRRTSSLMPISRIDHVIGSHSGEELIEMRKKAVKCGLAIDFIHQENPESVAPVCHLAGGHRRGIHEPRLFGPYRAHYVSDFSFSVRYVFCAVRCMASTV